ncbi:hypothetical protein BDU57DRAFT_524030 [Ampelomyces quisqualis]|uniref:Uncharacterized protein n=1 Tax=Ampelomyces quisqualis TaxID=50730 RepID=A0A6A5QAS2_AMPQU|nr:hypothetical protein BDU57DRAFT_524030 [Ampelomyces quisqualis]
MRLLPLLQPPQPLLPPSSCARLLPQLLWPIALLLPWRDAPPPPSVDALLLPSSSAPLLPSSSAPLLLALSCSSSYPSYLSHRLHSLRHLHRRRLRLLEGPLHRHRPPQAPLQACYCCRQSHSTWPAFWLQPCSSFLHAT